MCRIMSFFHTLTLALNLKQDYDDSDLIKEFGSKIGGLKRKIEYLLETKNLKQIQELLAQIHPGDIADLIDSVVDEEKRKLLFSLLDIETAPEVIVEPSEDARKDILKEIKNERLANIVEKLPSDEAADIIADLPQEKAERVLAHISSKDSAEVKALLKYPEETAGGLMQTEILALPADITVEEAIQKLRELTEETEEEFHRLETNLFGGLLTGYLMWLFKHTLSDVIALVTFIPVITGMGGNLGLQSSTITVRGLATGKVDLSGNFRHNCPKGIKSSLRCGLLVGVIAYLWHRHTMLGIVVGIAMFRAMNVVVLWVPLCLLFCGSWKLIRPWPQVPLLQRLMM